MPKGLIVRRKKLGFTSVKALCQHSEGTLVAWRADKPYSDIPYDFIIRWGCTSRVPNDPRVPVLNRAEAISEVNDKLGFSEKLGAHKLNTIVDSSMREGDNGEYERLRKALALGPVVIRPPRHAQGRNMAVVTTLAEAEQAMHKFSFKNGGWYATSLFPKTHEYRVCVVQGRVAWVAAKTPGNPDDVAWNVARGGRFDNVRWEHWPLKCVRLAVEAFNLSALHFGGVDVMYDQNSHEAKVLEINSAPSLTSPYRQQALAKCFKYILDTGSSNRIPIVQHLGRWTKYIHPAMSDRALIP